MVDDDKRNSGFGDGFGDGYGYGDGDDDASGDGSGFGDAYGDAYGDGYGYGYGYGDGYGDGDGHGYGDGHGEFIATLGGYEVRAHPPFAVVSVGCQTHTLSKWKKQWKEIAAEHGVDVTQEQVDAVLAMIAAEVFDGYQ